MYAPTLLLAISTLFTASRCHPTLLTRQSSPICPTRPFLSLRCCSRDIGGGTFDCVKLNPEPTDTETFRTTCEAIKVPDEPGISSTKGARCCFDGEPEDESISCRGPAEVPEPEPEPEEPEPEEPEPEEPEPEEPEPEEPEEEEEDGLNGLLDGLLGNVGDLVGDLGSTVSNTVGGLGKTLGGVLARD